MDEDIKAMMRSISENLQRCKNRVDSPQATVDDIRAVRDQIENLNVDLSILVVVLQAIPNPE